jgi:hypothetical protein
VAPIINSRIVHPITGNLIIFSDNQAAIAIAHHPEFHGRKKHIDIALHFLHDHIGRKMLEMTYVNTHNNLADLFMKGLPRVLHQDLMRRIGVLPTLRGSVVSSGL